MARNDFRNQFDRFITIAKNKARRKIAGTVGETYAWATAKTVINTGRYRANWILSIGALSRSVDNPFGYQWSPDKKKKPDDWAEWNSHFEPVIDRHINSDPISLYADFQLGETINVENSLYYAQKLEDGATVGNTTLEPEYYIEGLRAELAQGLSQLGG